MLKDLFPCVFTLALMAMGLVNTEAAAQTQRTDDGAIVLHIKNLDTTARDAVMDGLRANGSVQVSYACVPAGILVLRPTASSSSTGFRGNALAIVQQHVRSRDLTELDVTQTQAEELCAQVRAR